MTPKNTILMIRCLDLNNLYLNNLMLGPVPQHLDVSDYKVYKTLCALKTKKSPGPDGIPIVV